MFGTFPGANGVTVGLDRGEPRPLIARHRPRSRGHPALLRVRARGVERRRDGRVLTRASAADRYAYTQLPPRQLPNYWHWASSTSSFDNFFASAQGPSFPNHLFTIAATSGGAHDNPRARSRASPSGSQHVGLRRARDAATSPWSTARATKKVPPCFDFLTEGDLLNARRDPVGVLRGERGPERATSGARTRRSAGTARTRSAGSGTCSPWTTSSRTSAPVCCRPSRGSPRGSSSPSIPSTASATARTGPPR